MGWYEAIKDGIALAQKADNVPLVQNLIDTQSMILELQTENSKLKDRIKELEDIQDISEKIERHHDAYITLSDDESKRIYCSCCWDTKRILVQGNIIATGKYHCPSCGNNLYYDREANEKSQDMAISGMSRAPRR